MTVIEKVEGIIINERDYSESSKIIDLFTREHGLLSVMAKGVKKIKNNLCGSTTKLTYGFFHIYYKKDKLSTLITIDVINNFTNVRRDLLKTSYSIFICELVGQVVKQTTKEIHDEEIFNTCIAAFIKINEGFDPMTITNILEIKLLNYLGVCPVIDACAVCGNTTSILTLSADKGGYLCDKCRTDEYIVSDKTIKMIRMFFYVDIAKISKLDISDKVKNEIDFFINNFYDKHTGLYLKTKQFLSNIKKQYI